MQVLIHAGFHKTGTTTIQSALRDNSAALKPHLRVYLPGKLKALCKAARAYSVAQDPVDEGLIRYEAAELAQRWDPDDPRPILISAEDLCGHMPGRRGLKSYALAPIIMGLITEAMRLAQPKSQIGLHFSTRNPADWLRSCHVQHLRAIRITIDATTYAARMAPSADLDDIVDRIARVVRPMPVSRAPLEQVAQAPLAPLFQRLNLSADVQDIVAQAAPENRAPAPAWAEAVLRLNRSPLDHDAWKAARAAIHEGDYA